MILVMKIYIVWLIGVIIWNYGFPNASPLEDVLVVISRDSRKIRLSTPSSLGKSFYKDN